MVAVEVVVVVVGVIVLVLLVVIATPYRPLLPHQQDRGVVGVKADGIMDAKFFGLFGKRLKTKGVFILFFVRISSHHMYSVFQLQDASSKDESQLESVEKTLKEAMECMKQAESPTGKASVEHNMALLR